MRITLTFSPAEPISIGLPEWDVLVHDSGSIEATRTFPNAVAAREAVEAAIPDRDTWTEAETLRLNERLSAR